MNDRMHPEGAPGAASVYWRQQLGDVRYEQLVEHDDHMRLLARLRAAHEADAVKARASALLLFSIAAFTAACALLVVAFGWVAR